MDSGVGPDPAETKEHYISTGKCGIGLDPAKTIGEGIYAHWCGNTEMKKDPNLI